MAKKTYTAEERERLREQLLDRGQALFARYGYRAAPLKEVYEPLGISKTFFYTFFPGKEALAIQVLCRQRTIMLERAREVVRAASAGGRVWNGSLTCSSTAARTASSHWSWRTCSTCSAT